MSSQLTGGQALVESLRRHGVDVIFGLPGVQLDWAFDALYSARREVRMYHTRHEQAAAYMADGYARSSGKVGACLVVPGPGLLNAMAGLATAYACSSPVLCIAGQIPSDMIGAGRGMLHEVRNQMDIVRGVVKWVGRAMAAEAVPAVVEEAFRQVTSGRPRPVVVEIPPDVLEARASMHVREPRISDRPKGDSDLLSRAARALGHAERPVIFAGGGVLQAEAWTELQQLAEMLEAPVVLSPTARGALSSRHRLAHSMLAARALMPSADAVLAVGTRFLQPAAAEWRPAGAQSTIQIDADPEELGRNYAPDIGIVADAKAALSELVRLLPAHNRKRTSREAEMIAIKASVLHQLAELQPQMAYAMAIREELPDDAIVVNDLTQVGYWCREGFPIYEPRTFLTPGYQGTLGFAFPTALGAKAGNPGKVVVAVAGDGGFLYNVQELATAVLHHLNVIAIVFNDQAYGNVKRTQKESFSGRLIGVDLANPDFLALGQAFGVLALRAESPAALRSALRTALASNEPALIEVRVGEMPNPWPLLQRIGKATTAA